jgi:glyoxylase-like metal-dependent hydrolase (beta-lactamase superfamily II)
MSTQSFATMTVDSCYVERQYAASYLIGDSNEFAWVDQNTTKSLPHFLAAMKSSGVDPAQIKYLIVTHVHLDHAGGTSALLQYCPHAQVLAHPRAVRHLVDPAKLVASAKTVYGEAVFNQLYGEVIAIAPERVHEVSDGATLPLGQQTLQFIHTRGHANHHICIKNNSSGEVFTGDAFGLCYPTIQNGGLFIFPSTSPTDFDGEAALLTVDQILALQPSVVYPTHFGALSEVPKAGQQLRGHLVFSKKLCEEARLRLRSGVEAIGVGAWIFSEIERYYATFLSSQGRDGLRDCQIIDNDLKLNAQGLLWAAQKAT